MERNDDHAVVTGASVAGLLAARVLSDAYSRVTVVERDARGPLGENRKGVPQGRHVHGLLPRGVEILDDLFPGFTGQLTEAGAHLCDLFEAAHFCPAGRPLPRTRTGLRSLHASRPFLEGHLRQRVQALANVEFVDQCDVVGLVTDENRGRVTGIRLLRRTDSSAEEMLTADLVVDATGRASRTPAWLEALGYPRPDEEQVHIRLGYASCPLRIHPAALNGDKFVLFGAEPDRPSGLALSAMEGGRWILSLFGYGEHRPPADVDGFWAFAAQVAPPEFLRVIRHAEPLDRIVIHRLDSNLRRRYERLRRFPAGLAVVGDAVCSFNPIYAQGMTVAALEAAALQRCLEGGGEDLARRFFPAAAKALNHAWMMATGADLSLPIVEGRRTLPVRLVNAYMRRLLAAAAHDPAVATAFMRVTGMVDPLPTLLGPTVAFRVLWAATGRPAPGDVSRGCPEWPRLGP